MGKNCPQGFKRLETTDGQNGYFSQKDAKYVDFQYNNVNYVDKYLIFKKLCITLTLTLTLSLMGNY